MSGSAFSSQNRKTSARLDSCVSLSESTLDSSVGPNCVSDARMGVPSVPVSDTMSTGAAEAFQS